MTSASQISEISNELQEINQVPTASFFVRTIQMSIVASVVTNGAYAHAQPSTMGFK